MISFDDIEIREVVPGNKYLVLDLLNNRVVIEIHQMKHSVVLYDARREDLQVVVGMSVYRWQTASWDERTTLIRETLRKLLCERCKNDWGPVCPRCFDEVGDELFFIFKELQRNETKRSHDEVARQEAGQVLHAEGQ